MQLQRGHVLVGKGLLCQRGRDLPASVRPEIEAQHHIPRSDLSVHPADDGGLDEFVGRTSSIRGLHDRSGTLEGGTLSVDQRPISLGDAFPPPVAVHGPIAAADRRNRRSSFRADGFQVMEIACPQFRCRVPSVREGVDHHIGHTGIGCNPQQRMQVGLLAVDPALTDEPHEMQPLSGCLCRFKGIE